MIIIILNEWKLFFRNRLFIYTTVLFLLSLIMVVSLGVYQNEKQKQYRSEAQDYIKEQWDNLEAMNPHRAAHYGSYAFKPMSILNSMDNGVNDLTGNVIKLEGHVQNEIVYSEASQSLALSKFGRLKSSIILQYVVPLFLIFLSFGSMTSEKDSKRINLLRLQGVSLKRLTFSKSISVWIYGLLLLLITVLTQAIIGEIDLEITIRLILIFISYSLYYYVIACLSIFTSAILKDNTSALSIILSVWILWTIFIPKIFGNAAEKIYPLPSRQVFKTTMKEDRSKGIDGHNPRDERREALKLKYLKEYQVDSLKNLPINFDGIVMQEDEEYGNMVWDKHFGKNYRILQSQKMLYQLSGFLNPFASLQSMSMGGCGTDMIHHLDFLKKSEDYRRYLIKTLNDKHAFGGSKTGDWSWTVDSSFFRTVNDFQYKTPSISTQINHYTIDIVSMIWWGIIATFLIRSKVGKEVIA